MMLAVSGLLWERVAADADDARCVGASVGTAAADADDTRGPGGLCWQVRQLMLMMLAVLWPLLACAAADADDARCPGAFLGTCGS